MMEFRGVHDHSWKHGISTLEKQRSSDSGAVGVAQVCRTAARAQRGGVGSTLRPLAGLGMHRGDSWQPAGEMGLTRSRLVSSAVARLPARHPGSTQRESTVVHGLSIQ